MYRSFHRHREYYSGNSYSFFSASLYSHIHFIFITTLIARWGNWSHSRRLNTVPMNIQPVSEWMALNPGLTPKVTFSPCAASSCHTSEGELLSLEVSVSKNKKDKQHSQPWKLKTVGVWFPKDYEKSLGFYINKLASDLGARWRGKRRESTSRSERKENPLLIPFLLSPKGTTLRTPEKRERGTEVPTVVGWGQWEIREARTTPKFPQLPSREPIVSIHLQTPGDSEQKGNEKKVVWASGNPALSPPHQL